MTTFQHGPVTVRMPDADEGERMAALHLEDTTYSVAAEPGMDRDAFKLDLERKAEELGRLHIDVLTAEAEIDNAKRRAADLERQGQRAIREADTLHRLRIEELNDTVAAWQAGTPRG